MTRDGEALEAAKRFEQSLYNSDVESLTRSDMGFAYMSGIKWADAHPKSPWISVKDDLPCNHEELLNPDDKRDTSYVVAIIHGHIVLSRMYYLNGKWHWESNEPTHWFPIPKLP